MSAQYENNPLVKRYMALDVSPAFDAYTGVEIVVDENTTYFAGATGGRVITINNPWGTQAMAENILENLRGFTYQPYMASGSLLSPAAEIGDAVTLDVSTYSGIFKMSKNFSSLMSTDIEAPQDEEIDHEYPFETKRNREITRKFSAIESEFRIQSDEISAKVSKTSPEGQTSFSWSLQDNSWEVKSNGNTIFKVTQSGAEVTGTITATGGTIGGFTIGANAITYNNATWNGNRTGIYLGTQGLQLGAANGSFFQASSNGTVKAHNMTLTGNLYFKDSNGNTKSMNANDLREGAQSAFSNGGTWSGTSKAWSNATKSGTSAYPGFFTCGSFMSKNGATVYGTLSVPSGGTFTYRGKSARWDDIVVNGQSVNILTY